MLLATCSLFGEPPALAFADTRVVCGSTREVCTQAKTWATGDGLDFIVQTKAPCASTITVEEKSRNLGRARAVRTFALDKPGVSRLFRRAVERRGESWDYSYNFSWQCGIADAKHDSRVAYSLPFAPGQSATVSQGYNGAASHYDSANKFALDFDLPEGSPVHNARDGVVVQLEESFGSGGPRSPVGHVNFVRVQHSDHSVAEYAHLLRGGVAVKVGEKVRRGQLLGLSGNSGKTTGPHLHFAVHVPIDGKDRRSVPVWFDTGAQAAQRLLEGSHYRRP